MRRARLLSLALAALLVSGAQRPGDTVNVEEAEQALPSSDHLHGATQMSNFQLNWWSVNNGGDIRVESANYGLGVTIGQAVAGYSAGTNYRMGLGFWYVTASPGGCPIVLAGDLNVNGAINSADIIYLVNYVFKSGAVPLPCEANGDVTCDGNVAAADIIHLVNFTFKSGPDPCNTCDSPLAGAC